MTTSARSLSVISGVKIVTQLQVLPVALAQPRVCPSPCTSSHPSLRSTPLSRTLSPPPSFGKLPLARPPFESRLLRPRPRPLATHLFPFRRRPRRRRPNSSVPRRGSRAAGSGLSFPESHCLVGRWRATPAWASFPGFFPPSPYAPPPLSSTEAEKVRGQPWRRTSRSGCTRSSLRWFR